ncbi:hypothetical protein ABTQ07_21155, partial [Acinetobacter baumannii]
SDYSADGVSEDYRGKELRWKNAAAEVRGIIQTLRSSLERNDESAQTALSKARAAVESIGCRFVAERRVPRAPGVGGGRARGRADS